MPTYHVTITGKTYTVEIPNPHTRPVQAIVDGEVVEVAVVDATASMPVPTVAPVAVAPVAPPAPPASPPPPTPLPTRSTSASSAGGNDVLAPLPGTVVGISVVEGATVEHGQELCILEAMKMNNPIRATQAGTVTQIFIRIGEQVPHGAPLMRIA